MDLPHLIRRFFAFGMAQPLTDSERDQAVGWIGNADLQFIFFAQPVPDQRHGYDAAEWLSQQGSAPWMIQAGMLHDVGKRQAGLGRWLRALSTVLAWLRIVPPGPMSLYTAHDSTGADELAALGADSRLVAYTANHHGQRPVEVTVSEWEMLGEADRRN